MNYEERARLMCMTPMSMVEEFRVTMGQEKNPLMSVDLVEEEHEEWQYSHNLQISKESELKELADKVYVEYGYAASRGWDLDEALRRVHYDNMERCIQEDGTIKRREDGKIIKRENHPKIDLSDLV